jgi:hypothetical protein
MENNNEKKTESNTDDSKNKIENTTEKGKNNTAKVDISKLKKIIQVNYQHGDTYEMLIDEDGNEYELDGTPVKMPPKDLDNETLKKMVESGELTMTIHPTIYQCDMYYVYTDKNGNIYSLKGIGLL